MAFCDQLATTSRGSRLPWPARREKTFLANLPDLEKYCGRLCPRRTPPSKAKDNGLNTYKFVQKPAEETGARVDVPGDFFGAQFANAPGEGGKPTRKKLFNCIVTGWNQDHDWGKSQIAGAFTIEDYCHESFKMNLQMYSKYKHDTMKRKGTPAPEPVASGAGASGASSQEREEASGAGASDSPSFSPKHSVMWQHVVELTAKEKAINEGTRNSEKTHKCLVCSVLLKQKNGSTSNLCSHFDTDKAGHREIHKQIVSESKHSRMRKTLDGSLVQVKSFDERLELGHHVYHDLI